jgi:hypothetical protein
VGVEPEVATGSEVLVRVTWRDAFAERDEGEYDGEDYLCHTVGYLLTPTEKFVRVAQEQTPAGYRGVTHIPPSLIEGREVLSMKTPQVTRTETK